MQKKRTAETLAPELFYLIFQNLEEEPVNLLNCSLVSRRWCSFAIPILWKKSFNICSSHKRYKLVRIYLKLSSQEERFSLIDSLISKDSQYALEAFYQEKFSRKPALFDYATFLQQLDYLKLVESASLFWDQLRHKEDRTTIVLVDKNDNRVDLKSISISNIEKLTHHLWDILLSRAKVTFLKIDSSRSYIGKMVVALHKFKLSNSYFSRIQKFTCGGGFAKDNLINIMSQICREIEEITILSTSAFSEKIDWGPLIKAQRNLKILKLRSVRYDLTGLYNSLSSQINSLRHVKLELCLYQQGLPLISLATCKNLESLSLFYCGVHQCEKVLTESSFIAPLKSLQLNATYIHKDDLINLIIGSNKNLEELILDIDLKHYPFIDRVISDHCPNLVTLTTSYFSKYIITIMKKCKNLEILNVRSTATYHRGRSLYESDLPTPGQIFEEIAINSSKKLKKVIIQISKLFNPEEIRNFFKNCQTSSLEYLVVGFRGNKKEVEESFNRYAIRSGFNVTSIIYENRAELRVKFKKK
ncbi:hypothetical protein Glove_63g28 [Diversispora epigaea]|uniref:F-box domain-containing protein n=1 Tax=Diversispora epigaea TaxID=1348612 RepID=A0A397JKJ6_9GLOM|nr:hypothetical protein Glove_63g28 [Diversispora epigaea]